MNFKLLATAALVLFGQTGLARADVITSLINPDNGSTYFLLTSDTWVASQAEAIALGGNLVTINDDVENQWIFDNFTNLDGVYRDLWLGINDVDSDGNMVWVSGEAVTYTNWQPGNPSNSRSAQDYGIMWAGPVGAHLSGWVPGKWDDFSGPTEIYSSYNLVGAGGGVRTVHGLVEVHNVPEPATLALFGLGLAGFGFSRQRKA